MTARPILLHNGAIITMDPARPRAEALLLAHGRVHSTGSESALAPAARSLRAQSLDLRGRVAVPAFIDAHVHVLAWASRLLSVDCSPAAAPSVAALQNLLRRHAAGLPPGAWLRAAGYDEAGLAERRHPTRQELDAAVPDRPLRLLHRGGHAVLLNSEAMRLAGIDTSTPEPPGGYMDRDGETGEPTGLFIEMNEIAERAVPPLSAEDIRGAVARVSRRLLAAGITFVEDAGHRNGPADWATFESLLRRGALKTGVSLMEGYEHLGRLPAAGGSLRRGPVKVMPRETEHDFYPPAEALRGQFERIRDAGRAAAVHVVTRRGMSCVLDALEALGPGAAAGWRLEHAGICDEFQARRVAALGLRVVTQPVFIYANGDLMLRRLASEDLRDVYPLRRLADAGVPLAGSSDAPVAEADVVAGLRGAVERRSRAGAPLGPAQSLTGLEALAMFTRGAAGALGLESERGMLREGLAADVAVLDQDPTSPDVDWDSLRVEATLRAGEVVFSRASGPKSEV